MDSIIGRDDPVRLFQEVLDQVDWTPWEAMYKQTGRGQPPIHPKYVAGVILYGLYRGIRSSRKLEEACCYRFDFMWLAERLRIDHSTFSKFRTKFHVPLKDLFRQIGHIAMKLELISLGEVAFDGTRIRANNGRFQTRTARTLQEQLDALDELFEELAAHMAANDAEQESFSSPTELPPHLAKAVERRNRVRQALEKAKAADELRRKDGVNPAKNPAQIPTTDPDSRVMSNKEGGYAPNYTPTIVTDGANGFILDCDVTADVNERELVVPSMDRVREAFGAAPEKLLVDGGNVTGQIMEEIEKRDIEFYAPVTSGQPQDGNPAKRPDVTQPVPESQWDQLPRNPMGQLDKSCFAYDAETDQYYCPQGRPMPYAKGKSDERSGRNIRLRVFRSLDCTGCALASRGCLSKLSKGERTVTRDPYENVRELTAARMASEASRAIYKRRAQIAETPFGIIKAVMGMRQFLLRGLEKVKVEWQWTATAFNMAKLARLAHMLRANSERVPLATQS